MASEDFEFQLRAHQEFKEGSSDLQQRSGNKQTYVDPSDGTVYEWDEQKRGWFPMIDENFLAAYQSSYGVAEPAAEETVKGGDDGAGKEKDGGAVKREAPDAERDNGDDKSKAEKKQKPNEAGWFEIDDEHNHNVYVSGLPLDVTMDEFKEMMTKCGIIMEDDSGEPKIKLYKDSAGELKGDGLCCYLKIDSVTLALKILHESNLRGKTISVERAHFKPKGEYNPSLKKKKKKTKKKPKQEKLLDWRERRADGPVRKKTDKVVVFKALFNPKEFENDPTLITEIQDDLRSECEKFGEVKKIIIYDRHPEGVATLAFKEFESAELCVEKMNGRWYAQRQLDVSLWDGLTNYQVEETDQEREQRIEKWEKFLDTGGGEGLKDTATSTTQETTTS